MNQMLAWAVVTGSGGGRRDRCRKQVVTAVAVEGRGETAPFIDEALEALRRSADGQTETPTVTPIP